MITPENIIVIVSEYFRSPIDQVLSTCQDAELVKPRQVSMYFMKLYIKKISLKMIGRHFPGRNGYKNHATVLFAIKKVNGYIDTDKKFKRDINYLNNKIIELYGIESAFENIESEKERFDRLWEERESVLISENKYLIQENISLKHEIDKLKGRIYAMKVNRRKPKKRRYQRSDIKGSAIPVTLSVYGNPYKDKDIIPANNREFHGYREHSL